MVELYDNYGPSDHLLIDRGNRFRFCLAKCRVPLPNKRRFYIFEVAAVVLVAQFHRGFA